MKSILPIEHTIESQTCNEFLILPLELRNVCLMLDDALGFFSACLYNMLSHLVND